MNNLQNNQMYPDQSTNVFDPVEEKRAHEAWLNSEEHKLEVANKMKLFQLAVDDGALDHLNSHMTMISQLQSKLHRVVEAAMEMQPQTEQENQYQTVLGMIYSLVQDGRLPELHQAIKERFPEYYIA